MFQRRYALPRDASATYGDHLGPKIQTLLKQIVRMKIIHTSRNIFDFSRKTETHVLNMFLYTERYTESEYDIQNINLLFNIHQQCQNTFDKTNVFQTFPKTSGTL